MAKREAISEIVGRASFEGHDSVAVYRALRQLVCASCGAGIAEGELFTRRSALNQELPILPSCRKCAPFTFGQAGKEMSHPMIEALLSPSLEEARTPEQSTQATRPYTDRSQDRDERVKIKEAMLERLGPALGRTRRRRS
jgi:hypothetical protein